MKISNLMEMNISYIYLIAIMCFRKHYKLTVKFYIDLIDIINFQAGQMYPPNLLLDFYPLAAYCNHILTAFNELRLCAPISMACEVSQALESSLQQINRIILAFHR